MANKTYNNGRAVNGGAEVIEKESTAGFPLVRLNFILMAVSGLMIVLGFVLMAGSGSTPTEFNPDIFSARRVVVGPTISFLGFIFMGAAIMWPGKRKKNS